MNKRYTKAATEAGRPATLKDVARLAQVSAGIVSRVLANRPEVRVSAETRQRIMAAAANLEYHPNIAARSLKIKQTKNILLLIPNAGNPVYREIIQGAEKAADQLGYTLFLGHLTKDTLRQKKYITLWQEGRVDGLLIGTASLEDEVVDDLVAYRVPFIHLNRRSKVGGNYVIVDDAGGSQMAVDHLVALGHTRIAHLTGSLVWDVAQRRLHGYQRALREHNLPELPELCETANWASWEAGLKAMRNLLKRGGFTALLGGNLMLTVGAMAAIREAGLRIPQDISVVGINDAPLAALLAPPLTVVRLPLESMGYQGVLSLVDYLEDRTARSEIILPPLGLVQRESTGPNNG